MRYIISVIWIFSGLYLICLGGNSYWTYSTPNTVWVGTIPAFFAIGHLWLGTHSVFVGLAFLKTRSNAMVYLRTFLLVLAVFMVVMFVREFLIYGQWIANDYLRDELLLLFYVILTIGCIKYFHFPLPASFLGKEGLFDKKAAVTSLVFVTSIIALPLIIPYRSLEFLHGVK